MSSNIFYNGGEVYQSEDDDDSMEELDNDGREQIYHHYNSILHPRAHKDEDDYLTKDDQSEDEMSEDDDLNMEILGNDGQVQRHLNEVESEDYSQPQVNSNLDGRKNKTSPEIKKLINCIGKDNLDNIIRTFGKLARIEERRNQNPQPTVCPPPPSQQQRQDEQEDDDDNNVYIWNGDEWSLVEDRNIIIIIVLILLEITITHNNNRFKNI